MLFSGDVGRNNDPIMKPPSKIKDADYLVVESTYGDRLHSKTEPEDELEPIINSTIKAGGTVVIPAFAVGRAQNILYYIHKLKTENRISKNIPVYLDSPMAINATQIFQKFRGEHKLNEKECVEVCTTATYLKTADQSKSLNDSTTPSVIISASGMATGGRVLHHLARLAPDSKSSIVFAGFQSRGTRGDRLTSGEKELKIYGEIIPVRAHVYNLSNVSAHADYSEMLEWLSDIKAKPRTVFITHGEKEVAESLKEKMVAKFSWNCIIPKMEQSFEL
jgi:metallo-beta-lactamase family protein